MSTEHGPDMEFVDKQQRFRQTLTESEQKTWDTEFNTPQNLKEVRIGTPEANAVMLKWVAFLDNERGDETVTKIHNV